MESPTTFMKFYDIDELPDDELNFILKKKNHRYGAETILKPLKDGLLTSVGVAYQMRWMKKEGELRRFRAGLTATRRSDFSSYDLVQLPFDGWSVSKSDFQSLRLQQITRNLDKSETALLSLTDHKRKADTKAHKQSCFSKITSLRGAELKAYLEYATSLEFKPWIRGADEEMIFAKLSVSILDSLKRSVECVSRILNEGGEFHFRRSFSYEIGFEPSNDNEYSEMDEPPLAS